jgi:hypothetical protein
MQEEYLNPGKMADTNKAHAPAVLIQGQGSTDEHSGNDYEGRNQQPHCRQFLFFTGSIAPLGPGLWFFFFFSFKIILQMVGLLGWVISSSQGLYLNTGQHKHRIHAYTYQTIHILWRIRTHDPGFRASEDSACLRPLGYRDRQRYILQSF